MVGVVQFLRYCTGDEEGAGDINVEDCTKRVDGVRTSIAFAGDGGAGDEPPDRMTKLSTDGVEG